MQHSHYGAMGAGIYNSQRLQPQRQHGGASNPYSSMQYGHHAAPPQQQYGASQYAPPPPQQHQQHQQQQHHHHQQQQPQPPQAPQSLQQSWYQSSSQRSVEPTPASRYAGYTSQSSARAYALSDSAQPGNYSQSAAPQQSSYQSYTSQLAASGMSETRASDMMRSSQRELYDGRTSSSSAAGGSQVLQPESMSRSSAPMQPQQASTQGEQEAARYRAKIEELQGIADRQAADLRRRNEELLDLQRNHEAFREKFILFREGMRSKTDESDSRFRKLEAELKLNQVC